MSNYVKKEESSLFVHENMFQTLELVIIHRKVENKLASTFQGCTTLKGQKVIEFRAELSCTTFGNAVANTQL